MQDYSVLLELEDGNVENDIVEAGTTLLALARKYQRFFNSTIVLAKVNGKLRELN